MSVLNAALAGELYLKAIVAKEHPLLIFRDLFQLDDPSSSDLTINHIIERGKTYGLEHLPKLLWVATGERLPDLASFEQLRRARNAIQHFCAPDEGVVDLRQVALAFLYKNIDPLIERHFGTYAIRFHEDFNIGYDYVVAALIRRELLFSIPPDFEIDEIDLREPLSLASPRYRIEFERRIADRGLTLDRNGHVGSQR